MRAKLLLVLFLFCSIPVARAQTSVIDSLKKVVARDKRDSLEVSADNSLANEYARINIPLAKRYAQNAAHLARKLNIPTQLSASYSELTTFNSQTNQKDSALYYLDLLKKLADVVTRGNVRANYNLTAGLYYRLQGNFKASLPYMLECLRLSKLQGNKVGIAGQNLNLGNCYFDMGDFAGAMAYHLSALKLFEELGNKRGMSFCYSVIGGDFIKLKQYAAAIPYTQKGLALKSELNDKKGKAASYVRLAEIQQGLHDADKAMGYYNEALAIDKELKLPLEEANVDLSIGELYAEKKDADNAKMYFERSAALYKQSNDTVYFSRVQVEIARLQKDANHQQMVEKTFFNSIKTSAKMGDKPMQVNNYKYLSDFYTQNKQYEKALDYYKKYRDGSDSLLSKDLQLQIKELEQRYNLEKKEKEISLLKKDKLLSQENLKNQELFRYSVLIFLLMLVIIVVLVLARLRVVQKAKRLIEIEKMRNTIARNLHDDIGSTLSSINIMSKVALKQAGADNKISADLEKIKNSSFTIMESMSDIVWAINPANDPLLQTIIKMRQFAASILEPAGIEYTFKEKGKLADLQLGVDERKNFYLIFKEAINNIAKYSSATLIHIVLDKTGQQFSMKITDNGNGFDTQKNNAGNGLKNMKARSNEMNGIFNISSAHDTGTVVSIAIPIT